MNPQIHVKTTTYFNHTHVPDMVAYWPDDADTGERYIYLRTTTNPDDLRHDISCLARENRPVILVLGDFESADDARELHSSSVERDTLVLDLAALSALTSNSATDPLYGLISNAVIEGGRGVLDEHGAARLANTVTSGVRAARHGDAVGTDEAIGLAATALTPVAAQRMAALLTTLWQGSGSTLTALERAPRYIPHLDELSLTYLLKSEEITDDEFWIRIAQRVTLPELLQTEMYDSANLQHLMHNSLTLWEARTCSVIPSTFATARLEAQWRWSVSSGILTLHASGFRLRVAPKLTQLNANTEHDLPPFELIRERLSLLRMGLKAITLMNGGEKASYHGKVLGVLHSTQLDYISEALGPGAVVRDIETWTRSGVPLKCNFSTRAAHVKSPRGSVVLKDLIETSVRLFSDLSQDEESHFGEMIRQSHDFDMRPRGDLPTLPESEPPSGP
ncbi:hypothetical protein [Streptomyces sp. NPDC048419]|uniref:hypothetical protein n=1 Tax=Streptomyces sp. NPDC048419 TaxID=3365547 RepID=UPI0037114892